MPTRENRSGNVDIDLIINVDIDSKIIIISISKHMRIEFNASYTIMIAQKAIPTAQKQSCQRTTSKKQSTFGNWEI